MSHTLRSRFALWTRLRRQRDDARADRAGETHDDARWIARFDAPTDADRERWAKRARNVHGRPLFSLLMPVRDPDPRRLARAIASVQAQAYDRWELCIADDRSSDPNVKRMLSDLAFADPRIRVVWRMHRAQPSTTFNAALDIARGEHVALLAPDDALSEHALLCMAETIARKPRAAIVYSDEDCIDDDGQRRSAWCKPDWNRELFRGSGGLSHLGVFRTELVRRVGGFRPGFDGAEEFDLALRCVDATEPASIVHVPHILYHHRSPPATECNAHRREASELALADHFDRNGVEAVAAANDDATCTIQYALPVPLPRVSIIVVDDASLLRLQRCIHVLRTQTDYKPVEILVATRRASPLRNASFTGVRWVRGADGSLADACNRAARATSAELVVFIDSRCDRIARNWLRRLVSHAQLAHVGIVAPSCVQDGKAVGGGLVLGTKEGFSSRAQTGVAQQVSAIGHGCIAMRRWIFEQESGFDPSYLDLTCAVVDLSMRVALRGLEHHWMPAVHARLRRPSLLSRLGRTGRHRAERRRVCDAWRLDDYRDPFWNPNLSLGATDGAFACPPRSDAGAMADDAPEPCFNARPTFKPAT